MASRSGGMIRLTPCAAMLDATASAAASAASRMAACVSLMLARMVGIRNSMYGSKAGPSWVHSSWNVRSTCSLDCTDAVLVCSTV
jgi:hypothetical protein